MATRPKTREEAKAEVVQQMQENSRKLRAAIASNDKEAQKKYLDENYRLEAKSRSIGLLGELGSGMISGITGVATAIPDLLSMVINAGVPQGAMKIPSMGQALNTFSGAASEPTSEQGAYPYRIAQGLSGAALPGGSAKTLGMGGLLGAADVAAAQQLGAPEGVISGGYGVASILRSGWKGMRNLAQDRKFNKFLDQLPPDEASSLKDFMMKGQGSSSPLAAAALQKLQSNPEYAELFHKLEAGAVQAAQAGMAPVSKVATGEEATKGIVSRTQAYINGLFDARSVAGTAAFNQAKGYSSVGGVVSPNKVLSKIQELKDEYAQLRTPDAEAATKFLNQLQAGLITDTVGGRKLSAAQTQALLSEFGRKADMGDSLIRDISLGTEKRITSSIFSSLKDDLQQARIDAVTPDAKAATGLLLTARNQYAKATEKIQDEVAQGLPKFLQNKALNEIAYEDLYKAYKDLNPVNRAKMRSYVSTTDQEALKFIDQNVYKDFIDSARGTNKAGELNQVDLGSLVNNWGKLNPSEKDALTTALGTNASEFEQRMKDAARFSKQMQVGQSKEATSITGQAIKSSAATVGAVAGYSPAKAVEMTGDLVNILKKQGLNDEQLMKALLTREGADFLKNASLSPGSAKTLEALSSMNNSQPSQAAFSAMSRAVQTQEPQFQEQGISDIIIPPEFKPMEQPTGTEDIVIPSDLTPLSQSEQAVGQALGTIDRSESPEMKQRNILSIQKELSRSDLPPGAREELQNLLTTTQGQL